MLDTDPLTPEELREIEERAEAATEGPWEREWDQDGEWTGHADDPPGTLGEPHETNDIISINPFKGRVEYVARAHSGADTRFIAHARQDIPRLCRALREAWKERDELRWERDERPSP